MTEPIFDRVLDDLRRAGNALTHHHHGELPSQQLTTPLEDTTMSVITEIEAKIDGTATEVGGWFDDLKAKISPVVARVDKWETSKVAQAWETALLGPEAEEVVARFIADLAKLTGTAAPAAQAPDSQPGDAPDTQPAA